MLLTLVSFAFVITVLVFIHELGHYLAARSTGMRVEKFSVGFPPRFISCTSVSEGWNFKIFFYKKDQDKKIKWAPIFEIKIPIKGKKGSNTEYCLALLPLGGYVKVSGILDESMDPNSTGADYEYQSKKTWQKLWFTSAGVIFNFILSFIIFSALFYDGGYSKNKVESVFDKLSTISVTNISINGKELRGDDYFYFNIDYIPSFKNSDNIIELENNSGDLVLSNLNGEIISSFKFSLPIEGGDDFDIDFSSIDPLSINKIGNTVEVNLKPECDQCNDRKIYLGKVNHSAIYHQKSPIMDKLKPGDRIITINNQKVKYYKNIAPLIAQENSVKISILDIEFDRNGTVYRTQITPTIFEKYNQYGNLVKYGKVGVTFQKEDISFIESIYISSITLFENIGGTFKGIFELITGQISGKSVSGPIGIAKISGEFASQGFSSLLWLMAFLSISLGVINILPFPGLDGGHALIAIIEKIKGSKISAKTMVRIQQFGMFVLMSLFLLIILKDLGIL